MARPTSLYIPSYVNLGNHPKTRKLARALGISKVTAVGHLHYLWWWAATYVPDGDLSRVTNEDVTLGAEFDGDPDVFVQALTDAGFIDDRRLHDWSDYRDVVIRAEAWRPSTAEWADLRAAVFARDDYTCQYCGSRGGRLECDHVVPVARGGGHGLDNLATACFVCNRSKKDKLVEEWMQ